MKIIKKETLADCPVVMPGVKDAHVCKPLTSKVGAENFALRRFTLKPGGYTPYHQHAFEHLNYIIAGEGALKNEAGELQPLAAGDFAIVHPNDKHQFVNTGEVDFIFICGVTRDYE